MSLHGYSILLILFAFFPQIITAQIQWEQTNGPFGADSITGFHITVPGSVLLATRAGLYRSTNNGKTWQEQIRTPITAIASAPNNRIYAGSSEGKLYYSNDDGITWIEVVSFTDSVARLSSNDIAVTAISSSTEGDEILVAVHADYLDQMPGIPNSVLATKDTGATWEFIGFGTEHISSLSGTFDTIIAATEQGIYWIQLHNTRQMLRGKASRFLATSFGLFVAVGDSIYRSTNGGTQWIALSSRVGTTQLIKYNNGIYALTTQGLFRSDDSCQTWEQLSPKLQRASQLAVVNHHTFLVDLYGNSPWLTSDTGHKWTYTPLGIRNANVHALVHGTDANIFAAVGTTLERSTNRGAIWDPIAGEVVPIDIQYSGQQLPYPRMGRCRINNNVVAWNDTALYAWNSSMQTWEHTISLPIHSPQTPIDYRDTSTMVFAYDSTIYWTFNSGKQWDSIIVDGGYIKQVIIANDGSFILHQDGYSKGATLLRSVDTGKTWQIVRPEKFHGEISPILINESGTIIIACYTKMSWGLGGEVYTTRYMTGSIYASTDNGNSWRDIDNPVLSPIHKAILAYSIGSQSSIYTLTHSGDIRFGNESKIFKLSKELNWSIIADNVPDSTLNIAISPDYYLYAGTSNRGVFRSNRPVADAPQTVAISTHNILQVIPNPIAESATVSLYLPESGSVTVEVVDLLGQVVDYPLTEQFLEQGVHQLVWDAQEYTSGTYFLKMRRGQQIDVKAIIVD